MKLLPERGRFKMRPPKWVVKKLGEMEDRLLIYQRLWWRFWEPHPEREDRWQSGYFPPGLYDNCFVGSILKTHVGRRVYETLPYISTKPVARLWDDMGEEQQRARHQFVVQRTLAAYDDGVPFYPREWIEDLERQLEAIRQVPEPCAKVLNECAAPQIAYVTYPTLDGAVMFQEVPKPGARNWNHALTDHYGPPQVLFRSLQELCQPDPDIDPDEEVFAPDPWLTSIGFTPVSATRDQRDSAELGRLVFSSLPTMSVETTHEALEEQMQTLVSDREWQNISAVLERRNFLQRHVNKIVFFCTQNFMIPEYQCTRVLYLLAIALRIRAQRSLQSPKSAEIPIYISSISTDFSYTDSELAVLETLGITPVQSIAKLFLDIDENTAVISYYSSTPVKQVIADLARPSIFICRPVHMAPRTDFEVRTDVRNGVPYILPIIRSFRLDNSIAINDPNTPRVRSMFRDYLKLKLPDHEPDGWTGDKHQLACYVRGETWSKPFE